MVETTVKTARKASNDPVQEALRQHKDTWNHEASLLIAQLIAFKKGLNGRGESKVGLPPGSIKDPVPPAVGSYLDQLADRYNKLISDAHSIIDEQANYSENRAKSSKETGGQPITASFDPELIKNASWWSNRAKTFTKVKSKLKNKAVDVWYWFMASEELKVRMKLLKISSDFIEKLENIENYIVSKDSKAIPNSIYEFDRFMNYFNALIVPNVEKLMKISKILVSNSPNESATSENATKPDAVIPPSDSTESVSEKNIEPKPDTDEKSNINLELSGDESDYAKGLDQKQIVSDMLFIGPIILLMKKLKYNNVSKIEQDGKNLRKKIDKFTLEGVGDFTSIQIDYGNLLKFTNATLGLQASNFELMLKEVDLLIKKTSSSVSKEFEKFSANFMSRWLKRQKLKMFSDSDDRVRLLASNKIKKILKSISSFQNILKNDEKDINDIVKEFTNITVGIIELSNQLYNLGKNNNAQYEQERLNGKPISNLIKSDALNKLNKLKDHFDSVLVKINV